MKKDLTEFTKKLLEVFSKEYREKLVMLYNESYLANPEAFPLADVNRVDAYIIKGNKSVLPGEYFVFYYQGSGVIKDLGIISADKYSILKNFISDYDFIAHYINKIEGINKKPYFIDSSSLDSYMDESNNNIYKSPEKYIEIQKNTISQRMLRKLREDGSRFVEHIDKEASYYAQNAYRYAYTELDFSPVFNAVNDKDFEYALNESIACFDQSLYLAAVSTAGTALENLIIRILEINTNSTDDNSNTELGELAGRLRKAGIIDNREKRRIMLAANFRNLASHANKGRVIRQDAKLVYQEIFNLASKVFDV